MNFNQHNNNPDKKSHPQSPFLTPGNTVAIYTVLTILCRMKRELGIEAMHEYIDNYCRIIESNNPRFKDAVQRALSRMSVEKMYQDAMDNHKK